MPDFVLCNHAKASGTGARQNRRDTMTTFSLPSTAYMVAESVNRNNGAAKLFSAAFAAGRTHRFWAAITRRPTTLRSLEADHGKAKSGHSSLTTASPMSLRPRRSGPSRCLTIGAVRAGPSCTIRSSWILPLCRSMPLPLPCTHSSGRRWLPDPGSCTVTGRRRAEWPYDRR